MLSGNGDTVWINDIVSVQDDSGNHKKIHGFMIDVTERKQAESTLRRLSGRLITAQEEERKRIARELHDDLNQRMALISIELEQIGQVLENKTGGLAGRIKGLQTKAAEIATEIHHIAYKLHPSKLEHLGLASALRSFCSEFSRSRQLNIDFINKPISASIPAEATLCVFRVAQECLQNAAKYSGASRINVVLSEADASVSLVVSDNGCGFEINSGTMTRGLGFTSIRERLRLVNGTISVHSKPGSGTDINISVPLTNMVIFRAERTE
jgi:signal transduction histidine kinase